MDARGASVIAGSARPPRRRWLRPVRVAAAGLVAALLASCAAGDTKPAELVNDVGFRMHGDVVSTVAGPTSYHFEYGPTTAYGSSTPVQSLVVEAQQRYPVEEVVTGLGEGTEHHYRLCALDADGLGVCGSDRAVTTTTGHDSVVGRGFILLDGANRMVIGSNVMDAHSDPDGAHPTGRASGSPGWFAPFGDDEGPVTCLQVAGNRAAIGILTDPPGGSGPYHPLMVFIEDNGPTGDRWSMRKLDSVATTCPVPTAASITSPPVPGMPALIPSTIFIGGFAVHDHP